MMNDESSPKAKWLVENDGLWGGSNVAGSYGVIELSLMAWLEEGIEGFDQAEVVVDVAEFSSLNVLVGFGGLGAVGS